MDNNLPAASIEAVTSGLASVGYIASQQIATAVYLAERIEKPILVEGPAGVGKTELPKALASWRLLKMLLASEVSISDGLTVAAVVKPSVILTSNGEGDLSDALKSRFMHLHVGFLEQNLEERVVESCVAGIGQSLSKQLVGFIKQV